MYKALDAEFNPEIARSSNHNTKLVFDKLIKLIFNYISQPLTSLQNSIGTQAQTNSEGLFDTIKHNFSILTSLDKNQKEAASFLCGVLLLSESQDVRNATGGVSLKEKLLKMFWDLLKITV